MLVVTNIQQNTKGFTMQDYFTNNPFKADLRGFGKINNGEYAIIRQPADDDMIDIPFMLVQRPVNAKTQELKVWLTDVQYFSVQKIVTDLLINQISSATAMTTDEEMVTVLNTMNPKSVRAVHSAQIVETFSKIPREL